MNGFRVALFDVDGVLIKPQKLFSQKYCERYGVDPKIQEQFYQTKEFKDSSVGKFDLKDAIRLHHDKWQWSGGPDELLKMWFEGEKYPDTELLQIIHHLREHGAKVYLATQQEKYRAAFLQDIVFKGKTDGAFYSCNIGYGKHEDHFWVAVLDDLRKRYSNLLPDQIVYFDDRQSLVDKAKEFGITAYLYTNNESVRTALSL